MTGPDHVRAGGDFLRGLFWPGHLVGDRELVFDPFWVRRQLRRWRAKHAELKRERRSDVCVVVGNGPSLNAVDFTLLADQDVFISNYAFFDRELASRARYLCIVNYLVAEQEADAISELKGVIKLFPYWLSHCLAEDANTYYFDGRAGEGFSTNAARWVSWRSTVSYSMLQLAYSLGYRKVLLVGFDHSYEQSSAAREGDVLQQLEDDRNHFRASYFKGKYWQAASVENMERTYAISKDYFERDGREIVNCTVGGRLETFRRGDLGEELMSEPISKSASPPRGPSLGFRLRNVTAQIYRFCSSRSGMAVGAALFFLVAINGSFLKPLLPDGATKALIVDFLTFAVGFALVGYLYVKIRDELDRRSK